MLTLLLLITIYFLAIYATFQSRFCGNLGLPHSIQAAATRIAKKAVELDLVAGCDSLFFQMSLNQL